MVTVFNFYWLQENYGSTDLDKLEENDRVGVLRTSAGELVFYVNGVSQSVAATGLPDKVWAIVDLYGKCAQVNDVMQYGIVGMFSGDLKSGRVRISNGQKRLVWKWSGF